MNIVKKIIHIVLTIAVFLLLPAVVFTLITSKTNVLGGIQSFVVLTGSMQPTLPQGSVVYTKTHSVYQKGDLIAYSQGAATVTHRIAQVIKENEKVHYQTKGDANNVVDSTPVDAKNVLGKTVFYVPYVGNFILYLKSLQGFLLLIIFPSLIFIGFELWNIKKEIVRQTEERIKTYGSTPRVEI